LFITSSRVEIIVRKDSIKNPNLRSEEKIGELNNPNFSMREESEEDRQRRERRRRDNIFAVEAYVLGLAYLDNLLPANPYPKV
jgi:hypothetical protein